MLNTSCIEIPVPIVSEASRSEFRLDSTLQELSLYDFHVEATDVGSKIAQMLEAYPLLPGVILTDMGQFAGMISRRRFLEFISRPFGRELFLKRPVRALYRFAQTEILIFPSDTLIVDAAKKSLVRSRELLYEPIVVQLSTETYCLLDAHELLVAQSTIHELAIVAPANTIPTHSNRKTGQFGTNGSWSSPRNPKSCHLHHRKSQLFVELLQRLHGFAVCLRKNCR